MKKSIAALLTAATIFILFSGQVLSSDLTQMHKIYVDLDGFCGRWEIVRTDGDPTTPDHSSCEPSILNSVPTSANLDPEFLYQESCNVGLTTGSYHWQIKGLHTAKILFSVDERGETHIQEPENGLTANGGLGLQLIVNSLNIDANGFTGAWGFEHASGKTSLSAWCTSDDEKTRIPFGASWLLSFGQSSVWIHQDMKGLMHFAENLQIIPDPNGFPFAHTGATFNARTLNIEPATINAGIRWFVSEVDKITNQSGARDTVVLVGQTYDIYAVNNGVLVKGAFDVPQTCDPTSFTVTLEDGVTQMNLTPKCS